MVCRKRGCLGNYDFDHIARCARKRFIEGIDTVSLMAEARSDTEKEEIALVCLLSVEDDLVQEMQLHCRYTDSCKLTNCLHTLRGLLEQELAIKLVLPSLVPVVTPPVLNP